MRILIVDDSKLMRNAMKKTLTDGGVAAEFGEAGDGVEGLAAYKNHGGKPYSLVLVDWNMPNMVGLDMIKQIRLTDRNTPLVMVTTEAEKHRIVEAVKAGINGYIVKPFDPAAFVGKVKEVATATAKRAA